METRGRWEQGNQPSQRVWKCHQETCHFVWIETYITYTGERKTNSITSLILPSAQHPSKLLFNTPERWFHKQPNSAHFHASQEFWFHFETLVYRLVSIHKGINPNSPPSITLPQGKSSLPLPRITPSLYHKLQAAVPWARKWQCPQPTELRPANAHSWECHSWPPVTANNQPFPSYSRPGEIWPLLIVWFSKLTIGACLLRSGIAGLMYQFKLIPQNWESFYKPLMFGFHNFTTVRLIFKLSEAGLLK